MALMIRDPALLGEGTYTLADGAVILRLDNYAIHVRRTEFGLVEVNIVDPVDGVIVATTQSYYVEIT